MSEPFEPKIVAFVCTYCTYAGADLAGTSRLKYPPNVRIVRLPCTGRISPDVHSESFFRKGPMVFLSVAAIPETAISIMGTTMPVDAGQRSTPFCISQGYPKNGSNSHGSAQLKESNSPNLLTASPKKSARPDRLNSTTN